MQPNTHGHFHHPNPNLRHQPQHATSQSHKETNHNFLNPETWTILTPHINPTNMNLTNLPHHQTDHTSLYSTIFSLNLRNNSMPSIPMNSLVLPLLPPPHTQTKTMNQAWSMRKLCMVPKLQTKMKRVPPILHFDGHGWMVQVLTLQ